MLTSLQIAQTTGKTHFNVIRDILEEIDALDMVLAEPTASTPAIAADAEASDIENSHLQQCNTQNSDIENLYLQKGNTQNSDVDKIYENAGCEVRLTTYKDALGRPQPMYVLNEMFSIFFMAAYGKSARKASLLFVGEKLKAQEDKIKTLEIESQKYLDKFILTSKAFDELFDEALRVAHHVQAYKCDVSSDNQFQERQRHVIRAGGIEKISWSLLKRLVKTEMDTATRAEDYFRVQYKAQIARLNQVKVDLQDKQTVTESLRILDARAEQRSANNLTYKNLAKEPCEMPENWSYRQHRLV